MPQYNQSTIDNSNRLDPTFGLGNLSKAADNTIESRRRQAAQINAVRRTLSLKGIAPKGTIEVGESGVPEFDNASDKDAYYNIASEDRSRTGTGTTVTSSLLSSNRENAVANALGVQQQGNAAADTVIAGEKPVSQMTLANNPVQATLPQTQGTNSQATQVNPVDPKTAAVNAAMLKNKVLAPQQQSDPNQLKSLHSGQSISNSKNWNAQRGSESYHESGTNLQEVLTNTDIAVNDDVKMNLRDLMAADVNEGAVATVSGGAKNNTFANAVTQYGAVSQGIQNALNKRGTSQEIKDAGNWSVQAQSASGGRGEGVTASSSVNNSSSQGSTKPDAKYRSLAAQDGTDFKGVYNDERGTLKVSANTGFEVPTVDAGINARTPADLATKYEKYWQQQLPTLGLKTDFDKEGNMLVRDREGRIIGRAVIDSREAYEKKSDGNIQKVQVKNGMNLSNNQYTKFHMVFVNPNDPNSKVPYEIDNPTIQGLTFQLPK